MIKIMMKKCKIYRDNWMKQIKIIKKNFRGIFIIRKKLNYFLNYKVTKFKKLVFKINLILIFFFNLIISKVYKKK
jgi:hypothetical protein